MHFCISGVALVLTLIEKVVSQGTREAWFQVHDCGNPINVGNPEDIALWCMVYGNHCGTFGVGKVNPNDTLAEYSLRPSAEFTCEAFARYKPLEWSMYLRKDPEDPFSLGNFYNIDGTTTKTFQDSLTACDSTHNHLAVTTQDPEFERLQQLVQQRVNENNPGTPSHYWLGGIFDPAQGWGWYFKNSSFVAMDDTPGRWQGGVVPTPGSSEGVAMLAAGAAIEDVGQLVNLPLMTAAGYICE